MPGHWLLARLGKRVLRPGGRELTEHLLDDADLAGADVLEIAPGLGRTAVRILEHDPRSYIGIESDPAAAALTATAIGARGRVVAGTAEDTGLADASVEVVIGEAMLTLQSDRAKTNIVAEVSRLLGPGGRYAIHELALQPDTMPDEDKAEIRKALAQSIRVNARPLTASEWKHLVEQAGFTVRMVRFAPMTLLRLRRLISDEGLWRTVRFVGNVARDRGARSRILSMRSTFRKYREHLVAIELVAVKGAGDRP
ncbi:methyltransferase domain-containing protein [Nocardia sp. CT2-14]|uniref:Methyltransferase domain-containing protein n=2 Tax=Nocardia aurantiaca TaxID=2675850 RepID=A0A6I3L7S7_9NOCA|nr:class I SAM-dependent methyltransferase [Nocardia aurantiaca]MTE16774.1 methyltransferase domain-containing protein [Nocardia aurantiaca]